MIKYKLFIISIIALLCMISLCSFNQGKQYALDNMYIEVVDCIHSKKDNFDFAIYLDEKLQAQY